MAPVRDPLHRLLIREEGLRLAPYRCPAGFWTIAAGRNLEGNGLSDDEYEALPTLHPVLKHVPNGRYVFDRANAYLARFCCISESAALWLLEHDIATVQRGLLTRWPWLRDVDVVRWRAFVNLGINLGVEKLSRFRLLMAAAEAGDWSTAARELLETGGQPSRYAQQVPARAARIARAFETGQPEEGFSHATA